METPNYVPASHRKAKDNKYRISFHGLLRMLEPSQHPLAASWTD